jgi:hypothetical protein
VKRLPWPRTVRTLSQLIAERDRLGALWRGTQSSIARQSLAQELDVIDDDIRGAERRAGKEAA